MTEHTSGPWEPRFDAGDWCVFAPDSDDIGGWWIATMHKNMTDGTPKANAALIAAAPDLLALVEAVEWVDEAGSLVKVCAWCGGAQVFDHKDDCPRQHALALAQGQREQEAERD